MVCRRGADAVLKLLRDPAFPNNKQRCAEFERLEYGCERTFYNKLDELKRTGVNLQSSNGVCRLNLIWNSADLVLHPRSPRNRYPHHMGSRIIWPRNGKSCEINDNRAEEAERDCKAADPNDHNRRSEAAKWQPGQLLPPLSLEQYAALKESIRRDRVQVPSILDLHGNIIDGWYESKSASSWKSTARGKSATSVPMPSDYWLPFR